MRSARELIQDWNEEGIYDGNWITIVGFRKTTELVSGSDPDAHQALQNMMASGGRPIGLVGATEDDGNLHFESCMVKQYEGDSQAIQHVAAVVRRIQEDPERIMIQDIGADDFSEDNQHRINQEWARRHKKTIARFVRTRKLTSELQDGRTRTMNAIQPPRDVGRPEVTSAEGLGVEAVITKPATRTVGDLLEEVRIASQDKRFASLVVGFAHTTKFICSGAPCESDLYELLARLLDEGGDVVGMITLTHKNDKGEDCVKADAWLVREHTGQEWARQYLYAVKSSFMERGIVAATVGTREFLEAN